MMGLRLRGGRIASEDLASGYFTMATLVAGYCGRLIDVFNRKIGGNLCRAVAGDGGFAKESLVVNNRLRQEGIYAML